MTILYPTSFPSKVHFCIKNNVPQSFVPTQRCFVVAPLDLKGNANVAHFLLQCILPKSVLVLASNINGVLNRSWELNAVLVASTANGRVDCFHNRISFSQNIWNPPSKSRLLSDVAGSGIFNDLDGV